jgi:hypothetical protein
MRFRRSNKLLNEAIEALDQRLEQAKGDKSLAFKLLTAEEMAFVVGELAHCVQSRTYYMTSYHIIATERGEVTSMCPLLDLQWVMEEAIEKERREKGWSKNIVLKGRQTGGTEYANGVMCWCTFFTPYAYTMTVAQAPDTVAHVQRKVDIAWKNLPWWMQPEKKYNTKGEYLEFGRKDQMTSDEAGLESVFVTTHAQRVSGVAIGRSVRFLHMSELSRWGSGDIYTGDIRPSMNAPDTLAIAESTALGDGGFFYNLWNQANSGKSEWTPVFLPTYRARKYSLPILKKDLPFKPTQVELAIRARVLEEEKFRISDEFFNWRRVGIAESIELTGHPYSHLESFPISAREAFQSSGHGAFPRHKLDYQSDVFVQRPKWVGEISFKGMHATPVLYLNDITPGITLEKRETTNRFWIWERFQANHAYYVSCDVGGSNVGNDFNVIQVIRAGSATSPEVQVAEWVGWETPTEIAKILYAIGMLYGKSEIAVEYAKEGLLAANYLMNDLEYPNLYRPRALDRVGKQLANYMHWQTTNKSKTYIVTTTNEALLENSVIIRSEYLLNEMYKFSRDGQGYSGLGSKDDAVMSWCIGLYCLRQTMPELRSPAMAADAANRSPTSSARASAGAIVYGLYDQWFRLRTQTQDLAKAMEIMNANPGWKIKNIPVTKANTAHSIIHHETGPANDLYRSGVDSRDITPAMTHLLRGARAGNESDAEQLNELMNSGDMGGEMGSGWGAGMSD